MSDFRFEAFGRMAQEAAVRGLNMAATELRTRSIDKAPMDVGTLRGSAQVTPATPDDLEAGVSYDTPYAVRLHEHPEYHFQTDQNPNAQGKYLEEPLVEGAQDYVDIIARQMRGIS
ncbi:hypothetical protein [Gryllotalpicola koreensis]|uniref:HK97 gp10 family phage protein n=1 Tax=Gryllotalpicola koreensis TaxID=993086 RepID=A0ABP8A2X5_9MICO